MMTMTMPRAARLLAAKVAVLLTVPLLVAGSSWSARAFGGMAVPDVGFGATPVAQAAMTAVSCAGDSFCMAVGSYSDPSGTARPLAEKWDGQAWHEVAMLTGEMNSVSCVSASFCMAAGNGAATWDGARWHPMRGSPGGEQVSCSRRSFCMVASPNGAASWNGKAWHRLHLKVACTSEPTCDPPVMSALKCTSRSFCMAVGSVDIGAGDGETTGPWAEVWNGARWAEISVPFFYDGNDNASGLTSMSCTSSSFCLAVGPLGLQVMWDGTAWTALNSAADDNSDAFAVSCAAPDHCYLLEYLFQIRVGSQLTFESRINGTWQTLQAPPAPAGASISPAALACGGVTVTACTMVGGYSVPAGGENMTLAERWTGGQWLLERTPTPGDLLEGLSGVSCLGASFCVAVGSYHTAADTEQALAEEWNGHRWQLLHPVSPGTQVNHLTSVSCPTRTECVAVGSSDNHTGNFHTLAELWDGTSWSVLPTPESSPGSDLTAVSCPSAGTCMAVGSSRFRSLAEQWDGTTWTVLATPNPGVPDPQTNILSGISCLRPGWCMAVGTMSAGRGRDVHAAALAMVWNGTSWQQVPAQDLGRDMELDSVSCTRTIRCVAAGSGTSGPAAQVWNGRTWVVREPPRPARGQIGLLNGVSCPAASRCMAVGEYITTAGAVRELADAWNGRAWRSVRITSLSSLFSDLSGIDCTATARCMAAGQVAVGRTLAARWNGSSWHSQNAVNP